MTFVRIDRPDRFLGRGELFENGHQLARLNCVIEIEIGQLADAHAVPGCFQDGVTIVAAPDGTRAV